MLHSGRPLAGRGAAQLAIAAAVAAAALVRGWNLRDQVLGGDELRAVATALGRSLGWILTTYSVADHSLPLSAGIRLWLEAGGTVSEIGLRLPGLLCGVALVAVGAVTMARAVAPAAGARLAWLLAFAPALVLYSRIVRPYAPMVLLATGGLDRGMALDRDRDHARRGGLRRARGGGDLVPPRRRALRLRAARLRARRGIARTHAPAPRRLRTRAGACAGLRPARAAARLLRPRLHPEPLPAALRGAPERLDRARARCDRAVAAACRRVRHGRARRSPRAARAARRAELPARLVRPRERSRLVRGSRAARRRSRAGAALLPLARRGPADVDRRPAVGHAWWQFSRLFAADQALHGARVQVAGEVPGLDDPRVAFRNFAWPDPERLAASGAAWVVVHLDLESEQSRIRGLPRDDSFEEVPAATRAQVWETLRADAQRAATKLESAWGAPDVVEPGLRAWRLPR